MVSLEKVLDHCLVLENYYSAFIIFKRLYNGLLDDPDLITRFDQLREETSHQIGDRFEYMPIYAKVPEFIVETWLTQLSNLEKVQDGLGRIEWRAAFSERMAKYFETLIGYYVLNGNSQRACWLFDVLVCKELAKEIFAESPRSIYTPANWENFVNGKKRKISASEWDLVKTLRNHLRLRIKSRLEKPVENNSNLAVEVPESHALEWIEKNSMLLEQHKQEVNELNIIEQKLLLDSNASIKLTTPIYEQFKDNSIICLKFVYLEHDSYLITVLTLSDKVLFERVAPFNLFSFKQLINSFYYCLELTAALVTLYDSHQNQNYIEFVKLLEKRINEISTEIGQILFPKELEEIIVKHKNLYITIAPYGIMNLVPWEALITPHLGKIGNVLKLTRIGSLNVLSQLINKQRKRKLLRTAVIFYDEELEKSQEEAEGIIKIFDRAKWYYQVYSSEEFTKSNFLKILTSQPWGIVHFIGHGQYIAESPSFSNIRFNDSILTAKELDRVTFAESSLFFLDTCFAGSRPSMNSSVLNACETARSSQRRLEPIGLWRSMLGGGFLHHIGCNWEVFDDVACKSAMLFYEKAIIDKMTIAEALLEVRKKFAKEPIAPEARPQTTEDSVYTLYGVPDSKLDM